jgi:RNA polymerase sigma-B factor
MSRGMWFCSDDADEDIDGTEARMIIQEALVQLYDDERRLIWLRFFEPRSQSEIAEEIGTSQMQVSRLLSRLMVKIRMTIGVNPTPCPLRRYIGPRRPDQSVRRVRV